VFPWISLSIHRGGVKWIMIFGKDFDRPGWIKRFLRIYNYVEELLWFWNQKFLLLIQVCFYDSQCATTSHPSLKIPLHGTKGNLTPRYLVPSYVVKHGTIAYQNWNFFNFVRHPWCVSCLSSQELFTNIPSMSWPWDTRSLRRSIFLELFPLSFSAPEQQWQMKEMKLHDAVDQPLQERI
jgi:hypothetical protein